MDNFSFTGTSLMALAVALCLPYRSTCALVTWSSERFADASKTQREQGRAVLYRRQPRWQDVGHLYEEEECA
jgi:hypothetical protein